MNASNACNALILLVGGFLGGHLWVPIPVEGGKEPEVVGTCNSVISSCPFADSTRSSIGTLVGCDKLIGTFADCGKHKLIDTVAYCGKLINNSPFAIVSKL